MPYKDPDKARECKRRHYAERADEIRERLRRRYAENPEQARADARLYYAENHEKALAGNRKRRAGAKAKSPWRYKALAAKKRYGIPVEDYLLMLAERGANCPSCKRPSEPVLDHCHDTDVNRGLLCHKCNVALGLMADDPDMILGLHAYAVKWKPIKEMLS